ncbi:DUF862-domain-containing protein [Auriculariales sp. MPI-PUGE-AT-0066]|nr:DUF862-domain-containing protein [Auriculariales sp. MPI-PUGE-AT-0066]
MSKVQLYVYDLSNGLARSMSRNLTGRQIDGIWHTSVVVFGKEWYYGQGIDVAQPGRTHHGQPQQVVDIGETALDEVTFGEYIQEMREMYTADKYHLLDFNCNNFTNDVVGFLTGGSIPEWIKDLPADFLSTPFGQALRPTIDNMFRRPTPTATPPTAATAGTPTYDADLAGSFLQAVAAQAAGGQAPGSSIPATQTVAAPLQVVSNVATWTNILQTHRAVAVFFTSPTCAPCRMVEPVFEQLAEEKAGPGVAFVKCDFSVGRSGEVAMQYGVRATPSILFFLDGQKTYEIKGPDVGEMRTQIDLLLYTAFPPHPHLKLNLTATRSISTQPILFQQVPNFDAALSKFITFVDADAGLKNRGSIKSTLSTSFVPFLKRRFATPPTPSPAPSGEVIGQWLSATLALTTSLPAAQLFPLADFWRLAVLDTTVVSYLAANLHVMSLFLGKAASALDNTDSRNTTLTVLRLATNALSNDALARLLLPAASALLVPALLHSDARVRAAAASLAFNATALVQRPLMTAGREGKRIPASAAPASGTGVGGDRDGEWEVEMLSALVEAIGQERESEDVVHRLTAALAMLLHLSPHFDEQDKPLLEVLQARQALLGTLESCVKKQEVRTLVKEVAGQMCP